MVVFPKILQDLDLNISGNTLEFKMPKREIYQQRF